MQRLVKEKAERRAKNSIVIVLFFLQNMPYGCHQLYVKMFLPLKSEYFLGALTSRCRRLGYTPERQKEIVNTATINKKAYYVAR